MDAQTTTRPDGTRARFSDCATLILSNPKSGQSQAMEVVQSYFRNSPRVRVHIMDPQESLDDVIAAAAEDGVECIVAAGGDGTVNAICNAIAKSHSNFTLGIIPLGTANDFASTLAIPDDIEQACHLIVDGEKRLIDLVEVETESGSRFYANVATGGNSDRVTDALTDDLKQRWGPLCYVRGALSILTDLESYTVALTMDEDESSLNTIWNIIIANGRTNAGRLPVAPRANPEDGLLDVILIRDGNMFDVLSLITQFALADYLESEQVIYRQVKSIRLQSSPEIRFSIDGETIDEQPVVFRCVPKIVNMIVGSEYHASVTF